jgi:hypothetical protein
MSWAQVGEALGVAEIARQLGSSLAEAAWGYAAERSAHLSVPYVMRPGVRRAGLGKG